MMIERGKDKEIYVVVVCENLRNCVWLLLEEAFNFFKFLSLCGRV